MKIEGEIKITKRMARSVAAKIIGLKDLMGRTSIELAVKDPQSIVDVGKIVIEIPDIVVKKHWKK